MASLGFCLGYIHQDRKYSIDRIEIGAKRWVWVNLNWFVRETLRWSMREGSRERRGSRQDQEG